MVTPAPAETWPDRTSTGSRSVSRRVERTTGGIAAAVPDPGDPPDGTDPPTKLVLPPCGTIGAPCAAHALITSATSAVEAGLTTHAAAPEYRLVQSVA